MNSERQKREKEIERIMRESGHSRKTDVAFQEEVRKAASAMFEKETRRIQKSERAEDPKRLINPGTAGLVLLILGAGLAFVMPGLGATLALCGIAAIVWTTGLKSSKK
jgi:Flp pilus assembly protein TadB